MVIEVLFSEVCNLYGDAQNITYLQATLPNAEFIFTPLTAEPYFVQNQPDMIYIGSMSEATQRRVINKLLPYKARIEALIDMDVLMLATGNACEMFCRHIDYVTEELEIDALGIFDLDVKTNLFDRYNGKVLGEFQDMQITGFRSQFSFIYGDNTENYFVKCIRGDGINRQSKLEGMRKNNLFCTQMIGPILPLNPLFCKHILNLIDVNVTPAFFDAAMDAYQQRIKEFNDPNVVFGNNK